MKILLNISVGFSYAQENKISYTINEEAPGISATELYKRAQIWVSKTYYESSLQLIE